ncbi:multicopper oxidase [Amanita muscaria Koide BX008]|uniref:Multicopper oxidase n=1 Tax=Amanita muscaria (strain Koide BX008) TaxID=946122 RepID=A0A0C2S4E8_AMAMK|nr:multicopper oxidase [Amanita muscaria Koide BX008]
MRLSTAFLSSLLSLAYASIGPDADLYIVNKGCEFRLNVINQLTDTNMLTNTSIHWHGFFQEGTNWADGPVGVNQCPITSGNSFLYQFSVPGQAGTFWYHSHHSTQYCDGLRGPLVVYDPDDPLSDLYDVDNESTVISLSDWYHTPTLLEKALVPTPNATLINGLGQYPGGPNSSLAIVNVKHGTRYRMRLISMSCLPNFIFSIDNHNMTIIEADGISTKSVTVNSLQIFAAQRYSFVLKAYQPVDNYWIRATPDKGPVGSAILRYAGAPVANPTTVKANTTIALLETSLSPLYDAGAPGNPVQGGADVNINLNIVFNTTESKYLVNGFTFDPPATPVLLQILSGARTAQEMLPPGSVYILPRNKSVEVSIPGGSAGGPHPIHLHGQVFDVVRSAGSSIYNYKNPVRRDVVNTGIASDNVTFRFSTKNPGPWIMHCHIDWHLNIGLAIVFVTDVDTTATFDPPRYVSFSRLWISYSRPISSEAWDQLCNAS